MATIIKRGKKYAVVYYYTDENGVQRQNGNLRWIPKKRRKSGLTKSSMKWITAHLSVHPV